MSRIDDARAATRAARQRALEASEGHPRPENVIGATDFSPCIALHEQATALYDTAVADFAGGHDIAGWYHSAQASSFEGLADACSGIGAVAARFAP